VLSEGDKAPDFSLPDQTGTQVKLSDLRGETVVLYFYPRADTVSYNCSNGRACRHRHHPGL
jgi:peroxiredoxin